MEYKPVVRKGKVQQPPQDPSDYQTHKGCPRCGGARLIDVGVSRRVCQYYGHNKRHMGGE